MKTTAKVLGIFSALALALSMALPAAHASDFNQMTKITFSEPVRIPGNQVLPAGTYWRQTPEEGNTGLLQNVVQIYNADHSQLLVSVITRPTSKSNATGKTELVLAEASKGPSIFVDWFYPGTLTGHQFIYSAKREQRISREELAKLFLSTDRV